MGDLKNTSGSILEADDFLARYQLNISHAQLKKSIPRINLKKIKLSKITSIDADLVKKNITRIYLDDQILRLNFSFARQTKEYSGVDVSPLKNPLRKKGDNIEAEKAEKPEKPEAKIPLNINLPEQPVTFNLEAQITQQGENVIYTPSTVSLPSVEEDLLSTSGEHQGLIWPPPSKEANQSEDTLVVPAEKENIEKKEEQKKNKPYFISDESKPSDLPKSPEHKFPWSTPAEDYKGLDSIFGGGLEADLVDPAHSNPPTPVESIFSNTGISDVQAAKEQSETDLYNVPEAAGVVSERVLLKAISPRYNSDQDKEILNLGLFKQDLGDNGLSESSGDFISRGKASKMFEKSGNAKITPIRIVIVGGITITAAYLIWANFSSYFMIPDYFGAQNPEIVVRKLQKSKLIQRQTIRGLSEEKEAAKDSSKISPISEEQRLVLIQKARESIEGRADPFGQDLSLMAPVLETSKTDKNPDKPEEIQVERKQFELVGVVSVQSKNLALVNVYTADYSIIINDDKTVRENKLKQALSMAVPNRVEVSVLDPVEDWHVKAIIKGKTRIDDPYVELVKGDKKFTLKVGQKLLLPEDKPLPEPLPDSSQDEEAT